MSDAQPPVTAWKVMTAELFAAFERSGVTEGSPADLADGYIHMSTSEQLEATLTNHYAGLDDIWLVCVDLGVLGDALRWERSRNGTLFPHLYAPLPLSAAVAYGPLARDAEGALKLPVAG